MPRNFRGLAMLAVLLAGCFCAPIAAPAAEFTPKWHQPYLVFDRVVGNTDSDPQDELLFHDVRNNAMLLLDGLTGAVEIGFPEFLYGDADVLARDIDNDSRLELVLYPPRPSVSRPPGVSSRPHCRRQPPRPTGLRGSALLRLPTRSGTGF